MASGSVEREETEEMPRKKDASRVHPQVSGLVYDVKWSRQNVQLKCYMIYPQDKISKILVYDVQYFTDIGMWRSSLEGEDKEIVRWRNEIANNHHRSLVLDLSLLPTLQMMAMDANLKRIEAKFRGLRENALNLVKQYGNVIEKMRATRGIPIVDSTFIVDIFPSKPDLYALSLEAIREQLPAEDYIFGKKVLSDSKSKTGIFGVRIWSQKSMVKLYGRENDLYLIAYVGNDAHVFTSYCTPQFEKFKDIDIYPSYSKLIKAAQCNIFRESISLEDLDFAVDILSGLECSEFEPKHALAFLRMIILVPEPLRLNDINIFMEHVLRGNPKPLKEWFINLFRSWGDISKYLTDCWCYDIYDDVVLKHLGVINFEKAIKSLHIISNQKIWPGEETCARRQLEDLVDPLGLESHDDNLSESEDLTISTKDVESCDDDSNNGGLFYKPKSDDGSSDGGSFYKPKSEPPFSQVRGIRNLASTCYLNAILQNLFALKALQLSIEEESHLEAKPIACALKFLFDEAKKGGITSINPKIFFDQICQAEPDFKAGEHDCHELFVKLLEILGKESNELAGLFSTSVTYLRKCSMCKQIINSETLPQPILTMTIEDPLGGVLDNIESCLHNLMKEEQGNAHCNVCLGGRDIVENTEIAMPPKLLVLHLMRYRHHPDNRVEKLEELVQFGHSLDLKTSIKSSLNNKGGLYKYQLTGLIEHLGGFERGHYTTYVSRKEHGNERKWYLANDEDVKSVEFSEVQRAKAYMLFYELSSSSSINPINHSLICEHSSLTMASAGELACTYAALILEDDGIPITSEKISTIVKAANLKIESYWPTLFEKLLEKRSVGDLILSVWSGGTGAPVSAAPIGGAVAAPTAAAAVVEEKEEPKEESDDDMGFSLFD